MYMDEAEEEAPALVPTVRWVVGLAVVATIAWGIFPGSLLDLAANALAL